MSNNLITEQVVDQMVKEIRYLFEDKRVLREFAFALMDRGVTTRDVACALIEGIDEHVKAPLGLPKYFTDNLVGIYPSWMGFVEERAQTVLKDVEPIVARCFNVERFGLILKGDFFKINLPENLGVAVLEFNYQ